MNELSLFISSAALVLWTKAARIKSTAAETVNRAIIDLPTSAPLLHPDSGNDNRIRRQIHEEF
jgi:hypothetical protein